MKGIQWLVRLIISALITSMVCIASTFWVINTYVDMVLEQYQLKTTVQSTPNWSQLVGRLTQQLSLVTGLRKPDSRSVAANTKAIAPVDKPASAPLSQDKISGVSGSGTETSTGTGNNLGTGAGNAGSTSAPSAKEGTSTGKNPPEDAIAVFGHQSGQSSTSTGTGSGTGADAEKRVVVSSEEFIKKKEQLSNDDKNKIFNMLVTRVPQDEIQRISRLMEGGITASGLKEIEQVLQKYLKPDEYTQLLGMIKTTN